MAIGFHIALQTMNGSKMQIVKLFVLIKNDGENVNIRNDCYFRAHVEYKRPDVGLKIFKPLSGRLYSICARK